MLALASRSAALATLLLAGLAAPSTADAASPRHGGHGSWGGGRSSFSFGVSIGSPGYYGGGYYGGYYGGYRSYCGPTYYRPVYPTYSYCPPPVVYTPPVVCPPPVVYSRPVYVQPTVVTQPVYYTAPSYSSTIPVTYDSATTAVLDRPSVQPTQVVSSSTTTTTTAPAATEAPGRYYVQPDGTIIRIPEGSTIEYAPGAPRQ